MFRTKDGYGSLVCGYAFNYGIFFTEDENVAKELRKNRNVIEVIEEEKAPDPVVTPEEEKAPEPVIAPEKPKAKAKRGK